MSKNHAPRSDRFVPKSRARKSKHESKKIDRLLGRTWTGKCVDEHGRKKRIYTYDDARRAALGLMLGGTENKRLPRHTITTYACSRCGGWHVGHDRRKLR